MADQCAFCKRPMTHIRLLRDVRADWPFGSARTVARAGVHRALFNQHGAISVIAEDGGKLGVKPGEFEWAPDPEDGNE